MRGEAFGLPLAQTLRTNCTECGSGDLKWGTALDVLAHCESADLRQEIRWMIDMLGGDSDAWICRKCPNGFGIFGPTHFD